MPVSRILICVRSAEITSRFPMCNEARHDIQSHEYLMWRRSSIWMLISRWMKKMLLCHTLIWSLWFIFLLAFGSNTAFQPCKTAGWKGSIHFRRWSIVCSWYDALKMQPVKDTAAELGHSIGGRSAHKSTRLVNKKKIWLLKNNAINTKNATLPSSSCDE